MSRLRPLLAVVLFLAALTTLAQFGARWAVEQISDPDVLKETACRLQLVIDEQDIGLVQQGTPLEVAFTVGNTGSERLVLRQAPRECCGSEPPPSTFTIEPGQAGEVVALLTADELLGRGRKHIRFYTSDVTCPELWVTVRGTVIRQAAASEDDERVERSVLVK
jgi:hypothetical protein